MIPGSAAIKSLLGTSLQFAANGRHDSNELIVVNYHSTPKRFIPSLETQLRFYEQSFEIVSPDILDRFFGRSSGQRERPMLLLTFDDGLKNNLYAVDLLQKRNIKGLFSVVPGLIETAPSRQKEYLIGNVNRVRIPGGSQSPDDFSSMTWADLKSLIGAGHVIASHSYTHRLRLSTSTPENSQYEIGESKNILESMLGCPIRSYVSPDNTLASTGETEIRLIKENYSFHFSTLPGSNWAENDPYFIKRANAEIYWSLGQVKYSIGKFEWVRWKAERARFRSICAR